MIISLSGKAGSGKSTIAKLLAETLHGTQVHLATTLRDELASQTIPRHLMDTQEGKASLIIFEGKEMTVREAMCAYGARRFAENPSWLLDGLLPKCVDGLFILDDCRRRHEAAALAHFGPVIRIEHFEEVDSQEPTEVELDDWPYFDMTFFPAFGQLREVAFHIARGLPAHDEGFYARTAQLIHA